MAVSESMQSMSDIEGKTGSHAARKFYDLPDASQNSPNKADRVKKSDDLLRYVEDNVLGKDKVFSGPYGMRRG